MKWKKRYESDHFSSKSNDSKCFCLILEIGTSGGKRSRTINRRARMMMKRIILRLMLIDHPFLLNCVDIKTNP